MDNAIITQILTEAVNAPSGDNAQPWRFHASTNSVEIELLKEADPSVYDFKHRGSFLAHGALVENIRVAAAQRGYVAFVTPLPDERHSARIEFSAGVPDDYLKSLYPALRERTTNRKRYESRQLDNAHRDIILSDAARREQCRLILIEDRSSIESLARAVATNERVLMENRPMHTGLFSMIRWNRAAEVRQPGMHVKTMEFPGPLQVLMRYLVRHWSAVSLLNMLGFSRMVPQQSAVGYAASSAFGALIVRGTGSEDYLHAGMAFESIWLAATLLGVSLQPVTAIPYLHERIHDGGGDIFTEEHRDLIEGAYVTIEKTFDLKGGEHIAMIFRIGYGPEPSARAHKHHPKIEFV